MNAHIILVCRAPLPLAARDPVVSSTVAEPKLAGQASVAARASCAVLAAREGRGTNASNIFWTPELMTCTGRGITGRWGTVGLLLYEIFQTPYSFYPF